MIYKHPVKALAGMTSYGQYYPDIPIIPILFTEIVFYDGTIGSPAKFVFI
jgi:hypothetical protein